MNTPFKTLLPMMQSQVYLKQFVVELTFQSASNDVELFVQTLVLRTTSISYLKARDVAVKCIKVILVRCLSSSLFMIVGLSKSTGRSA